MMNGKKMKHLVIQTHLKLIWVFLLRGLIDVPPYSYLGLLFTLKKSSPSFPSDAERGGG